MTMEKLIITLEGEIIDETILDPKKEFILGRGDQCDIRLSHSKISRQHAKVYFEDNVWKCKIISKFGKITLKGHDIDSLDLVPDLKFTIDPFDLYLKSDDKDQVVSTEGKTQV